MEIDEILKNLKEGIVVVAGEICRKEQRPKKQNWMNSEILQKMEERRNYKNRNEEEQFKKLRHAIQKLCREVKDNYYEEKCKEIVRLDKMHSHLLYQLIKELRPKGNSMLQAIKSKQGRAYRKKMKYWKYGLSMLKNCIRMKTEDKQM